MSASKSTKAVAKASTAKAATAKAKAKADTAKEAVAVDGKPAADKKQATEKKPASKQSSAKTSAAKKTAAQKPATKEAAGATKAAGTKKTAAVKKSATEKPAAAKAAVRKTAAAKTSATAQKSAEVKPAAAKKPATRKAATTGKQQEKKTAAAKEQAAEVEAATVAANVAAKAVSETKPTATKPATTKKSAAAAKKTTSAAEKTTADPKKGAAVEKDAAAPKKASAAQSAKKESAAAKAASTKRESPVKDAAAAKRETAASKSAAKKATAKKAASEKQEAAKKTEPAKRKTPAKKAASAGAEQAKAASVKAEPAKAKPADQKPAGKEPVEAKPADQNPANPKPAEEKPAASAQAAEEAAAMVADAVVAAAGEAREPSEFAGLPGVLIAAAECSPLVKVGGLADVVGALPKYLKKLGVDARVILPFHRQIKERYGAEAEHMADFQASLGWRSQYVGLERLEIDGVIYYFIDNEFYFGGPIYCGGEFEGEQYAFFTRAVMDAIPLLDFEVGILHCNDWHTAMMPLLVKTQYQGGMQSGLKTLLTIHNLHFQGQFSHEFDRDLLGVDDSLATPQFVEHYGCDNMLKAGIVFSDKVNTVSPTYAREICEPYLGESLDGVLRSRGDDLSGILNAIDYEEWNPQTDPYTPAHFSQDDLQGKREIKDALLEELGLWPAPEGEDVPLIGMVGRLTPQKGIDLVQCVLDDIMRENVRVVILGSGYSEFENFLRDAENRYKGRLCSFIGYAGELSHRIYAASDLFLMPSLFEPCGISQMISMRYGTLPVVRETGGLRDTVVPYNEFTGEGNGFSFANYNAHEMLDTIRRALAIWWNRPVREQLVKQAMATDFSFDRCARSYAELYQRL